MKRRACLIEKELFQLLDMRMITPFRVVQNARGDNPGIAGFQILRIKQIEVLRSWIMVASASPRKGDALP